MMTSDEFRERTRKFGVEVAVLIAELPRQIMVFAVKKKLIAAALNIGSFAKTVVWSKNDSKFVSKMKAIGSSADEVVYWLDVLVDSGIIAREITEHLRKEAAEIRSMVVYGISKKVGEPLRLS